MVTIIANRLGHLEQGITRLLVDLAGVLVINGEKGQKLLKMVLVDEEFARFAAEGQDGVPGPITAVAQAHVLALDEEEKAKAENPDPEPSSEDDDRAYAETSSLEKALNRLGAYISRVLEDPIYAVNVARDPVLPGWLRDLASITSATEVEPGTALLAPATRELVDSWLGSTTNAQAWLQTPAAHKAPRFLVTTAQILGKSVYPLGNHHVGVA